MKSKEEMPNVWLTMAGMQGQDRPVAKQLGLPARWPVFPFLLCHLTMVFNLSVPQILQNLQRQGGANYH